MGLACKLAVGSSWANLYMVCYEILLKSIVWQKSALRVCCFDSLGRRWARVSLVMSQTSNKDKWELGTRASMGFKACLALVT